MAVQSKVAISRHICRAIVALSVLVTAPSYLHAEESVDQLFQNVLQNPDSVEANIAFAAAAEAEGNLRHAMAAYERASRSDPGNRGAYWNFERVRTVLSPPIRSFTLSAGPFARTNVRQASSAEKSDFGADVRLDALDEQTLASGIRLRTIGNASLRAHTDTDELNELRGNLWTGPVYRPTEVTEVHLAAGGGASWFNDALLFGEVSGRITASLIGRQAPYTLTLYGGFRDVNDGANLNRSDGFFLNLNGRFSKLNAVMPGDAAFFQPFLRYSDGTDDGAGLAGFDDAQIVRDSFGVGARVSYFIPVLEDAATIGAGARVGHTLFNRTVAGGQADRRDTRIDGTLHLLLKRVFAENVDLRFDYRYEHNISNDSFEEFDNHVLGSRIIWKF